MRAWLLPAAAALAISAAYSNGLDVPFVFDDQHVIVDNPAIRTLSRLPSFFVDPATSSALPQNRNLRPLLLATFALNYQLSALAPWSYHVVNLLLHWLAAVLVYRIVRDHLWLGDDAGPVAIAAAMLVAVHPLNSEPVNYVSARSALLCTVFYLTAFDAACRNRSLRAVALAVCAMLTKEFAVSLPLMVLVHRLIERRVGAAARPLPWRLLAALAVVAAGGVAYRVLLLPPDLLEAARQPDVTPRVYLQTEWSAYLYYLRLFVWPDALVVDRVDYPWVGSPTDPRAWGSLLVLAALGVGAWRLARIRPAIGFCALWVAITLAPESSVFPLAEAVNEHRPYVAMLGFGGGAASLLWLGIARLAPRLSTPVVPLFAVTVVVLVLALGGVTHARTDIWRDEFRLWMDVTEKAPQNPRGWTNAGHAALLRGDLPLARRLLLEANRLTPCYAYIHLNMSGLAEMEGQPLEALHWADEAVRCNPELALAHARRGAVLQRLERTDAALAAYAEATRLDAAMADAWFLQGQLFEARGGWMAARDAYARALAADPTRADAAAGVQRMRGRLDAAAAVEASPEASGT